jgi:hypothetical protein
MSRSADRAWGRSALRAFPIFAAVVATGVALGGCGASPSPRTQQLPGQLPACASVPQSVSVPRGWTVPLPRGTVVTRVDSTAIRQVIGYAPMPYADAIGYFRESYPKLGYRIGSGDAEMDEAEADFFGHGTRGRWRVNALTNCPGATLVTIAAG